MVTSDPKVVDQVKVPLVPVAPKPEFVAPVIVATLVVPYDNSAVNGMVAPEAVPEITDALVVTVIVDPALIVNGLQKTGDCVKAISLDIPFTATPMVTHGLEKEDHETLVLVAVPEEAVL